MTHQTSCIHWKPEDTQPSGRHYRLRIFSTHFSIGKLLFTFFKNNINSEKNKCMLKVNIRHTRARSELFSK